MKDLPSVGSTPRPVIGASYLHQSAVGRPPSRENEGSKLRTGVKYTLRYGLEWRFSPLIWIFSAGLVSWGSSRRMKAGAPKLGVSDSSFIAPTGCWVVFSMVKWISTG